MAVGRSLAGRRWARYGTALAVSLVGALPLLPSASPAGATVVPRVVGPTCAQSAAFPYDSEVVGMAETQDGGGYWIVTQDGHVAACGDALYLGEQTSLNAPVVGIAATPDGGGYYLVASDGGVFTFGDAQFRGSTGSLHLNEPVIGMAVDPTTGGYWLVAIDGGIFAYGAPFLGSTGSMTLNKPVIGMAAARDGSGYWLVATDGGVFAFGAPYWGSTGSIHLNRPVVGIAVRRGFRRLLARRVRRRTLCVQRPVLRLDRRHGPERADRRHGGVGQQPRLPIHRRRWWRLHLRNLGLLRDADVRPAASPASDRGRGLDHGRLPRPSQKRCPRYQRRRRGRASMGGGGVDPAGHEGAGAAR